MSFSIQKVKDQLKQLSFGRERALSVELWVRGVRTYAPP